MFSDGFDFTFGDTEAEKLLSSLRAGDTLPASHLLAMLDGESENTLEETFDALEELGVTLKLDQLPQFSGGSETDLRLRREEQLVKTGSLMQDLEETDPLRLYLEELAGLPVCGDLNSMAEELKKANLNRETDAPVYTAAMNLSLSRVVELAETYTGRGVLLMDLIQEGGMGLWQGLFRYTGGDLEQFRDACIRTYMTRAVVTQAHAAGVGQKLRQALEDYRSVDEKLLVELGRNPTLEEIAEGVHMTPEQTALVADMIENARTLSRAKAPENLNPLPEEDNQAVEDTAYFQMRQRIAELLSCLSEEDAKLLTLRYGLEDGLPLTPQQVGAALGLTSEEVVARESAALAKLREP